MTSRRLAFKRYQSDIYLFSRDLIGVALYPYQVGWAQYILDVMADKRNETIVVEMSRQSGKNQGQAAYQVATLARFGAQDKSIVACAPTYRPQLINSKMRFESLSSRVTDKCPWLKFKGSMGYIYKCRRASIHFLSADPGASVVGATASLILNVDEAQDTDADVYQKKFSPMRASTNAPVVLFGTTWDNQNLLAKSKASVLDGRTPGKVFRVTPEVIALSNPAYGEFVDGEVRSKGRQHPYIKTQYYLEELDTAGRMLNRQQLELMIGDHPRQDRRNQEPIIVAGLDFAGADEQAGELVSLATASARDSVALTIGAVTWIRLAAGLQVPHVKVLARYEWVNINPVTLHNVLYQVLWERWRINRVHCDATGIGATGTAMLQTALNKHNREVVIGVTFDSAWNTQTTLAFNYLAAINNGHLVDYLPTAVDPVAVAGLDTPPTEDPHAHIWWQRGHAKLEAKPSKRVRAYVPEDEGHDDLLVADMLCVDAAYNVGQPATMKGATVDFYAQNGGTAAAPAQHRSDEEIERMLRGNSVG